jgi:serine/threonine protein kinase
MAVTIGKTWMPLTKAYKIPKLIDGYVLIKKLSSKNSARFTTGIYQKNHRKYIIKTWNGLIKDLNYYSLLNEYRVDKLLSNKCIHLTGLSIRIPKSYKLIQNSSSLSAVFEYIDGKELKKYTAKFQSDTYKNIVSELAQVYKRLSLKEKSQLDKRSFLFYGLTLLPLTFVSIFVSGDIISSTKCMLKGLIGLTHCKKWLTLAHRDLSGNNILIKGNHTYLLDTERMVITLAGYDLVHLAQNPDVDRLSRRKIVNQYLKNNFLWFYVSLQFLLSGSSLNEINGI